MVWRNQSMFLVFGFSLLGCVSNSVGQEPAVTTSNRSALIVVGAPGEEEYSQVFRDSAERWRATCSKSAIDCVVVDGTREQEPADAASGEDRQTILSWIRDCKSPECWVVLIGHGTSDRDSSKFNLKGPDISAAEMAKAIAERSETRWLVLNCGSSSGPFINAISAPNRVVITATKSGSEQNYARFGMYLSQTISDSEADLDHDYSISILEAYLAAADRVAKFYQAEDRLATEQSLLDDNGDSKGTPAAFYRGARPVKAPADGLKLDGSLAGRMIVTTLEQGVVLTNEQRTAVEMLEGQIEILRTQKSELPENEYYAKLEELLLKIIEARAIKST